MNLLQITDLQNGQIQIAWQRGLSMRVYPHPIPFTSPLNDQDRALLRWYLEAYLQFPYGAERDRAAKVEARMAEWGEALFRQAFPKAEADPDPRTFYHEAVREGLAGCEICIASDAPVFLNEPWELLRDPTPGRGYLAPLLGGLFRRRSGQALQAPIQVDPDAPFRILLVIARPRGEADVPLGTVARPVLEAIRPLRPRVQLDLLRPPTFDALQQALNERPGYYHLVHFDGHGEYSDAPPGGGGTMMTFGPQEGRGSLVFEWPDGTPHVVNSHDLGQALAACRVPLFVLNACQSAQEGPGDPFSSVAAQLVATGAQGVVAMSYSVYAQTAAQFMGRFYERLIGGAPLSQAVAAGRQGLYAAPERQSVIGPLELRDWPVPALYQQEAAYTPLPAGAGRGAEAEPEPEGVLRRQAEEACPAGRFGFVGRDYDLLRIERALRDPSAPWALLVGMGGTGKTALAYGFARWYAETGGCPGGVFAASFKEKASFALVVGSMAGYGTDFSRLPETRQWDVLVRHLRENRCLLVWDNLETVSGYPAGSEPLASDAERARLARFLQALRGGQSRVLLTTRQPDEDWLGVGYRLVEVGGLNTRDAGDLAREILASVGRAPAEFRDDPDYSRLLGLLRGHPRSLEVVLPQLRRGTPGAAIAALQHQMAGGEGVLDASLAYACGRLSARACRHLPFLGLFAGYVDARTIANFVSTWDEGRAAYREVVGEALDGAGWRGVLEEGAAAGLLRPLGADVYELHPTLPAYLRGRLAGAAGEAGAARLDGEYLRFYTAWADAYFEGVRKGERDAVVAVHLEEANLLRALRLAEAGAGWEPAGHIAQTLCVFYEVRGRAEEWRALRARLLGWTGRELGAGADPARAELWMFLLGNEAKDALVVNDLAGAEGAYRRILDYLLAVNDPAQEYKVATAYHQLGMVAQERGQWDEAEGWYRRAAEIRERLGLERDAALVYHQLGNVAEERGQYDEAEGWYRRALAIRERLGLERDAADDYGELGNVARHRGRYDEAESWYRQALEIHERMGLEQIAATDYHNLGIVTQERGQYDEAEGWYRRALAISERLGLERDAATVYHQLGRVAEERGQYDEAEGWYRRALAIRERLGLPSQADTLTNLGVLRAKQGRPTEAVAWFGRALQIATQYQMRSGAVILRNLARVLNAMGEAAFRAAWGEAFPEEPPMEALRAALEGMERDH